MLSVTRDEGKVDTPVPRETTHGVHGNDLPVYHPPSTFEGYGVEGVEVGQTQGEGQGEGGNDAAGGQEASTALGSAPAPPSGPVFRIQLEGFAAPFTASKIVGPEDWLVQNVNRATAVGEEGGKLETNAGPRLTSTVRGILVIDSPQSFTLGDVSTVSATPANARDDNAGNTEGEANSNPTAAANLNETLVVFPPSCGLGSEGSVTVLGNGSGTMSCPDGKCASSVHFPATLYISTD